MVSLFPNILLSKFLILDMQDYVEHIFSNTLMMINVKVSLLISQSEINLWRKPWQTDIFLFYNKSFNNLYNCHFNICLSYFTGIDNVINQLKIIRICSLRLTLWDIILSSVNQPITFMCISSHYGLRNSGTNDFVSLTSVSPMK